MTSLQQLAANIDKMFEFASKAKQEAHEARERIREMQQAQDARSQADGHADSEAEIHGYINELKGGGR